MGEQLVAAGMHTGDNGDRDLAIDRGDVGERQVRREIKPATPEILRYRLDGRVHVEPISVNPSARSSAPQTSSGTKQMIGNLLNRTVVVSSASA
jgi:hypothetical protein